MQKFTFAKNPISLTGHHGVFGCFWGVNGVGGGGGPEEGHVFPIYAKT